MPAYPDQALDWLGTHRRRVFLDMHLPDWDADEHMPHPPGPATTADVASGLDPVALAERWAGARVEVAVVFAKCQYGNFYCHLPERRPHSGLAGQDFLGEMVEQAHARGIRVLAYYSNRWDAAVAREHPQWRQLDADGRPTPGRWPALCLSSPYRQQVVDDLRAIVTNYDVDGVWSDMVHGQPCFATFCQDRYRHEHGVDLPTDGHSAEYVAFLRWQQTELGRYLAETRSAVKEARPDAAFVLNFYGTTYARADEGLAISHQAHSDAGSTEGYSEWHGLLYPSYAARYMQMATNGRPFEVLTSRFVNTWDFTVKSPAQIRFESFSVAANGGAVTLDDEPYHDGRLEPVVYDRLADAFEEMGRRHHTLDTEPLTYCGLYHSDTSRTLDLRLNRTRQADDPFAVPSDVNPGPSDLLPSTLGAFKALVEGHVPVTFVSGATPDLESCEVVYLPNVLHVGIEERARLAEYVWNGGGLVASGATSLYDVDGNRLETFGLNDLFGVDAAARGAFTFPYVELADWLSPSGQRLLLPHYMAAWDIHLRAADVEVAGHLWDPIIETTDETTYHNNQPSPAVRTSKPAVTLRTFGKGRVAYLPCLLDSNFARLGLAEYRHALVRLVTWAAGAPPMVTIEGFHNTEMVVGRQGGDVVVHLVTGNPTRAVWFGRERTADCIAEVATLHNLPLQVRGRVRGAYLEPDGEHLPRRQRDGHVEFTVPTLRDWTTIRLEGVDPAGSRRRPGERDRPT